MFKPTSSSSRHPLLFRFLSAATLALVGLSASACGGGGGGGGGAGNAGGGSGGGGDPPGSEGLAVVVTPTATWWIGGGAADDFDAADLDAVYTVSNVGTANLHWTVELSEDWLSVDADDQGWLEPGQSEDILFHVDAQVVGQVGVGPAVGYIRFASAETGVELAKRTVLVDPGCAECGGGSGWTTFMPSADTRRIYVSSATGNDQNDGLAPTSAKYSIAAGKALLRDGYPDWLLLRRGDTWLEPLGQWAASGRSPSEPMLVAFYGGAASRPQLRTGTQGGIWTEGSTGAPSSINNLAIVGLHFRADGYSGHGNQVGANMLVPSSHVLIEGCMFEAYSTNIVFQGFGGRHKDFRLRRSVIVDAYSIHGTGFHPHGLYAYAVDGLLLEENLFDHNGWNESVPDAGADTFSHNVYIDNDNTGVVVRGNIIANGASHGVQMRSGGVAVNNLFLRNSISLSVGGGNHPEPAGVTAEVHQNVFLDGKNIDASNPRGWAVVLSNIASGHVSGNVIANNSLGTQPLALGIDGDYVGESGPAIGVHDLTIGGNVLRDWGGCIDVIGGADKLSGVVLYDNDVQDLSHAEALIEHLKADSVLALTSSANRFYSGKLPTSAWTVVGSSSAPLAGWQALVGDSSSVAQQVAYSDPDRSPATYNALLGGAQSLHGFLEEVRKQSVANWRPEYTAIQVNSYLRAGFSEAP